MADRPYNYASTVVQVAPHWPGIAGLKTLIVFGASYCDVGYSIASSPPPTPAQPLGEPFPGTTYAEPGAANWVGHLVTRLRGHCPEGVVVYDFARGGDTTAGVERQITREFVPRLAQDTSEAFLQGNVDPELQNSDAVWKGDDTLFFIWVGVNDCGYSGPDGVPPILVKLFRLIDLLYAKGARNFVLVDLPPMQRSPAVRYPRSGKYSFEEWNDLLRVHAAEFTKSHADATMGIYSSWHTFTRVLDDPVAYGFKAGDEKKQGGSIWVDHIHPTSKMHEEIAKDMLAFIEGFSVYEQSQ